MKSSIKFNIISNFVTQIWSGLIQLIFVPTYINMLGADAYGLIGFYTTLLGIFTVLDLGLGAALSRELARYSTNSAQNTEAANLTYTLERLYWSMGLVIGLGIVISSDWMANSWLNNTRLPASKVHFALIQMGILTFFRWPTSLYNGGLVGIQQQVQLNAITLITETAKAVGVIFILKWVQNDIQAFFNWQIIITLVATLLLRAFLWKNLNIPNYQPTFSKKLLLQIARFSAGVSGISLVVTILMQTDKLILSKILPLDLFGYYTLSFSISFVLFRVISPIATAFYPRIVQAIQLNDSLQQRRLYHQSSQLMAVVIIPISLTLSFFSKEIIGWWLKNDESTKECAPLVSVLILGTMCNGLVTMSYYYQLANGWTKLAFWKNVAALFILIPLLLWLTQLYGSMGASFIWASLNISYLFVEPHIFHHKYLKGEKIKWYLYDILIPFISTFPILILGRYWLDKHPPQPPFIQILVIGTVFTISLLAAGVFTKFTRHLLMTQGRLLHQKFNKTK
ncbi:oligosaccharide flippase family protein [Runella zeae]|uniref:oligosaccharide flippase family protein n=1 Tax=Runella zeae TaxID=94255 RepID=UPI002355139A|nr:oligosaccharide flippase family protein [Runella zeae]